MLVKRATVFAVITLLFNGEFVFPTPSNAAVISDATLVGRASSKSLSSNASASVADLKTAAVDLPRPKTRLVNSRGELIFSRINSNSNSNSNSSTSSTTSSAAPPRPTRPSAPIISAILQEASLFGDNDVDESRVYHMKKCKGAGCPYTASWLSHINLYRRVGWFLDSTKMEAASFNIFDRSHLKFQLSDPDAYFVHHMSMFEHLLHKKHGFDVAANASQIMSHAAFHGECDNVNISTTKQYLVLIPFYGGLPPDVTADFSQVKSIGQGNSLVKAEVKVLQCMATLCSTLRYFGHAVIGVTRPDDRELIASTLQRLDPRIRRRTHLVQFGMAKPAHLPFHLLAWGQTFVRDHNCRGWSKDAALTEERFKKDAELYTICSDERLEKQHKGGPVNVTYHSKPSFREGHGHAAVSVNSNSTPDGTNSRIRSANYPIRFVYYTEMDQVVRFDSLNTLRALSKASNESCFFVGRRKEKNRDSIAEEYMGTLDSWRECGEPGYSMSWPNDHIVRPT